MPEPRFVGRVTDRLPRFFFVYQQSTLIVNPSQRELACKMNIMIAKQKWSFLTYAFIVIICLGQFSCTEENDEKQDDGSSNTTDVAVTSNVSKLGISYAHIDGYVNLNLITSSYSSQQIGVELSMNEEFNNPKRAISKELEGKKLTVIIDTLTAQTKYYYRTFVKVNDLNYYGEKRSFVTKDFSNITSTGDASELTFTSAKIKCSGNASSIDKDDHYTIGIAYSTSKTRLHPDSAYLRYDSYYGYYSMGFNTVECSLDSLIKNKSFVNTISRLQTGTTYYYCSFTRAGKKYKLGEVKNFATTSLTEAQLSTGDATDITFTSAKIQNTSSIASLYPKGTYIQYGIRYGTSKGNMSQTASSALQEKNTFTIQLRNLQPGQTYYYCAYVSVDGILLTGETKIFTTLSGNSYLTTEEATDITLTSATLKGKSTLSTLYGSNSSSIQYTIRYSKNSSYLKEQYNYNYSTATPKLSGNDLSASITNLQMSTTYYYCIVAYVDGYYVMGDIKSFTTKSGADYLKTDNASEITLFSATLTGTTTLASIYPSSTSIQYSIRYATSSSNLSSSYNSSSINVTINGNTISGTVSNLKSGTTYYYCVTAYVGGTYIYGETKNFTTKSGADYLKVDDASNITMTSANIKGTTTLASVYSNNSTIQYRIVYGTSSSSLISSSNSSATTPELSGTTLMAELTNLIMATTYYYCVRAYVNGSYYYSDIKSFTTNDIPQSGYVDLGVSCNWATCNLGAKSPEDYGDYYAWGETETRTFFYSSNYSKRRSDVPNNISGTDYDAARKNLGSPWRMPTEKEFQEILNSCFWKEITYKNVRGYLVTGKNGNAIFLPKTGYKSGDGINNGYAIWTGSGYYSPGGTVTPAEYYSCYWSGTTISDTQKYYYGMTIRPVRWY